MCPRSLARLRMWHRAWRLGVVGLVIGCTAREPEAAPPAAAAAPTARAAPVATPVARTAPLLGLLRLPTVFGTGPCERFTSSPVALFSAPSASVSIGTIDVQRPWSFPAEGGCEGLEVVSRRSGVSRVLPTREIGYEEPAALVVGLGTEGWYRVMLDDTSAAWVRVPDADQYRELASLVMDALTFFTEAWDGRLVTAPDSSARVVPTPGVAADASVRVREVRATAGALWGRVEVLSQSGCDGGDAPRVTATGWVRLHAPSGAPTVWYSSRGC